MKKWLIYGGIILAAIMVLGITSCSADQLKTLDGILKNIDGISGNVTVTLSNGQTETFNLADISLNDVLSFADNVTDNATFTPGDRVKLKMNGKGTVDGLGFQNEQIRGTLAAIDSNNSTDSVATENSTLTIKVTGKSDISLKLTPQTLVVIEAQGRSTAADLAVGQDVIVQYNKDTMTVEKVRVNSHTPAWQNRQQRQAPDKGNIGHPNGKGNNGGGNKGRK
jgi:hypothetical protein